MSLNKCRKGQFFSYDAIIGGVVFLIAMAMLFSYWFGTSPATQKESDLARETLRLSDMLLTPGSPEDWQTKQLADIKQIGVTASYDANELDDDKFKTLDGTQRPLLLSIDSDQIKSKLNFVYEFNVTIETDTSFISCFGKCGPRASSNPAELVEVNRVAVLNNDVVRVKVNAWYEK